MFRKILLDNDIPVLLESVPDVRSLCIGIWVRIGARYEDPVKNGISHFLEHMFFKGTATRTAEGIAMETDSLGGELNAMTSTEYTLFYMKVIDEYMVNALDLLSDIFLNSTFPEKDIEKEKNIITEEIKMVEDMPSDYIHELFSRNVWGDEGLGQPILGSRETIGTFTRDDLLDYTVKYYCPENILIACSGNFSEEEFISAVRKRFGGHKKECGRKNIYHQQYRHGLQVVTKDLSETHICLGIKGIPYGSDERYAMHLLNTILGSGYSSRLFQKVREKRGLAYSIYSYHGSYVDTGLWTVYAGTDSGSAGEVIDITLGEMRNLSDTITADELQRAKAQLKGNLILALESTSNKMTNIAKQEIYYGRYFQPAEVIRMVEAVTLEGIRDLSRRLLSESPFALTVYGPVSDKDILQASKQL